MRDLAPVPLVGSIWHKEMVNYVNDHLNNFLTKTNRIKVVLYNMNSANT